ncbi:hypothetical protein TIFTF001_028628 [Ficus carica]|uniref:Uncharacterized protein n=1 Tax=Ficus carica TaxID=3494 RepID=A0AA88DQB2_FICCA|nr:hypothetical protein TIFTF001_028628 [Ficus carica]
MRERVRVSLRSTEEGEMWFGTLDLGVRRLALDFGEEEADLKGFYNAFESLLLPCKERRPECLDNGSRTMVGGGDGGGSEDAVVERK